MTDDQIATVVRYLLGAGCLMFFGMVLRAGRPWLFMALDPEHPKALEAKRRTIEGWVDPDVRNRLDRLLAGDRERLAAERAAAKGADLPVFRELRDPKSETFAARVNAIMPAEVFEVAAASLPDALLRIAGVATSEQLASIMDGLLSQQIIFAHEFGRRFPAEFAAWEKAHDLD